MHTSASEAASQAPLRERGDNWLVIVALLAFAGAYGQFFGSQIASGFRLLAGDSGDTALVALLHEHVLRSLLGKASLLNPQFFFPARGVLGYTDAFLLNQIFYAPLRLAGLESLLALQLTFMLLAAIGGGFFAALLARFFGVRLWLAILASAIFAFSHNLYLKSIHPQHFAIYYLPALSYLFLFALLAARSLPQIIAAAFGAGLLLGLTLLTGYYMGWFFIFFLMLALPVFLVLRWHPIIRFVQANRTRAAATTLAAGAGLCLGAVALLLVYGPVIQALQGLTTRTFLLTAATFRDLINVSDANLVWGWVLRRSQLIPLHRLQAAELHLAVTPLLVASSAVGVYLSARAAPQSEYDRWVAGIGIAVLFGFLSLYALTISIRAEWSPFLLVHKWIPGAVGIRVGFRSQVISGMFVCLAFALATEAYLRRRAGRPPRAGAFPAAPTLTVLAVGSLLVVEQIDVRSVSFLDRAKEAALIAAVPPPPAQCAAFAYYNDGSRSLGAVHVDAIRISQKFGLPTVNGYSGGNPPGWNLGGVWAGDYLQRVKEWLHGKGFTGPLCYYVEPTKTWTFIGL